MMKYIYHNNDFCIDLQLDESHRWLNSHPKPTILRISIILKETQQSILRPKESLLGIPFDAIMPAKHMFKGGHATFSLLVLLRMQHKPQPRLSVNRWSLSV
jgi:hypothetical protein